MGSFIREQVSDPPLTPREEKAAHWRLGNIYLGHCLVIQPSPEFRVRVGSGVVAPVMNAYNARSREPSTPSSLGLSSDSSAIALTTLSTAPNGGWDSWLVWRGWLPFVLKGDVQYRHEYFFVGGDLGLGVGVPVIDEVEDQIPFAFQAGAYAGGRPIRELSIGMRFQTVVTDRSQGRADRDPSAIGFASLVPFLRVEFKVKGLGFLEGRFFISLADNGVYEALGEKSWGIYLLGGSFFDFVGAASGGPNAPE
ncbi:MAG: hypothetical protein RMJ84_04190 [Sandaracinaceae bacterium]|nr:hypothetical protein [Sandaracinaceae bacterium]